MESTFKDLIADSEKEFNYKSEKKDHKNHLLRKYLYVHSKGLLHSEGSKNSVSLESTADVAGKALHDLLPTAADGCEVVVKDETPELRSLKDVIKDMKITKKKLEGALSDALDMAATLTIQKFAGAEDFNKMLQVAMDFLSDYRTFVSEADRSSVGADKAPGLLLKGKALKGMMDAHLEGIKHSIKKYKPFVN